MATALREQLNEYVDSTITISSEVIVRAKGNDTLVFDIILNNPSTGHINAIRDGLTANDREGFRSEFKDIKETLGLDFTKGEIVFRYKDNSIIGVVNFDV